MAIVGHRSTNFLIEIDAYAFPFGSVFVLRACVCTVAPFHLMFRKFEKKNIEKYGEAQRLDAVQSAAGWLSFYCFLILIDAPLFAHRSTHTHTRTRSRLHNKRTLAASHSEKKTSKADVDAQRQSTVCSRLHLRF